MDNLSVTTLPQNFQEVMMNFELEFNKEINETTIRKLIYVYTYGMQYYNIKEQKEYENYYREKLNGLLLNQKVISYLDTNKVDLSKKINLNIFNDNSQNEQKNYNTSPKLESNLQPRYSTIVDINSIKKRVIFEDKPKETMEILNSIERKLTFDNEDIMKYITKKIKEVDIKLKLIEKEVGNCMVDQISGFEANKRLKKANTEILENNLNYLKISSENKESNSRKSSSSSSSFNLEPEITEEVSNRTSLSKRRSKRYSTIAQSKVLKEIEEYVEENMKDMYAAIEELKNSYEPEIKQALESGYSDVADALKEDLKLEEENLTAQYEEERLKQIQIIRERNK